MLIVLFLVIFPKPNRKGASNRLYKLLINEKRPLLNTKNTAVVTRAR